MMLSVITINYNNKLGLKKTLESVVGQSFDNFEYIIIDGDSNDGSKEVIEDFKKDITYWVSEPDSGIYNAMNKGIIASKGNYLLFLNSGDLLHSSSTLATVENLIDGSKDIYYGNLLLKSKSNDRPLEYPSDLTFSFVYKNSLPHPASFIKRELFGSNNLYSETLKLVSDWQFFMKAIFLRNAKYEHLDLIISNFDTGGFSSDPKYKGRMEKERRIVMKADFPLLYDDMLELESQRELLDRKDVKMLLRLQHSKIGKKIHMKILKWLLKLLPPSSDKTENKAKDVL